MATDNRNIIKLWIRELMKVNNFTACKLNNYSRAKIMINAANGARNVLQLFSLWLYLMWVQCLSSEIIEN